MDRSPVAITVNGPSAMLGKSTFQVTSSELQILGASGGRAKGPKMAMLVVPVAT